MRCVCGDDHTGSFHWPVIKDIVNEYGETVSITLAGCTYTVPRVWIAMHGLKASELSDLAKKYGWIVTQLYLSGGEP
jgi:hypothetical protein